MVGVAFGHEVRRRARGDELVRLVGGGDLGGDPGGLAGTLVVGEPEVPKWTGGLGEREERFVGDVGEGDRRATGEGVLGAERDHSPLGDEDLVDDVVGINRQPQEGGVGDAVAQAGGGVAPSEGSQFYPPAGLRSLRIGRRRLDRGRGRST